MREQLSAVVPAKAGTNNHEAWFGKDSGLKRRERNAMTKQRHGKNETARLRFLASGRLGAIRTLGACA